MQTQLIDLDFLYEIADNDPGYICEVMDIFLSTMPEGLEKLETIIREGDNWDAINKQAHFLKSSVSVVKIRDMFDKLNAIERLAKAQTDKEQIVQLLDETLAIYKEAHPLLVAEVEKQRLNAQ